MTGPRFYLAIATVLTCVVCSQTTHAAGFPFFHRSCKRCYSSHDAPIIVHVCHASDDEGAGESSPISASPESAAVSGSSQIIQSVPAFGMAMTPVMPTMPMMMYGGARYPFQPESARENRSDERIERIANQLDRIDSDLRKLVHVVDAQGKAVERISHMLKLRMESEESDATQVKTFREILNEIKSAEAP